MRRALAEAGVPQPRFAVLPYGADVASVARQVGLPCVIKPLGLSGSRGVIRANDAEQACSTVERVRGILADAQQSPEAPLLLESYLPGTEVALEGLLRGGRLEVLAVFDKPDPLEGPYFEETL
jgi:biotin carboxylase